MLARTTICQNEGGAMCLPGEGRTLQAVVFVIFGTFAFATGCVDSRQDTSQPSEPPRAEFSAKDQEAVEDFVDKVMTLDNDNEIIIYFKNAHAPPADPGPRAERVSELRRDFPVRSRSRAYLSRLRARRTGGPSSRRSVACRLRPETLFRGTRLAICCRPRSEREARRSRLHARRTSQH